MLYPFRKFSWKIFLSLGLVASVSGQGVWVVSHCLKVAGIFLIYNISIQTANMFIFGAKKEQLMS